MNKQIKTFLSAALLATICVAGSSWKSEASAHTGTHPQKLPHPFSLPTVPDSDIVYREEYDSVEFYCPDGSRPYENCHGRITDEACNSIHRFTCPVEVLDPLDPNLGQPRWSPFEEEELPSE